MHLTQFRDYCFLNNNLSRARGAVFGVEYRREVLRMRKR